MLGVQFSGIEKMKVTKVITSVRDNKQENERARDSGKREFI